VRRTEAGLLDDGVVVVVPYGPALDAERRAACEVWWERHAVHLATEIQARQNLNTLVALHRAHADGLAWLLHVDCDEAFICDRPAGEHFGALVGANVDQVHYLNREAQLEVPDVADPFLEVSLFKRNPLEGGMPFFAYKEGKAAVSVPAALGRNARPAGSIAFAGFEPGRSRTFEPNSARVLHYPYSSVEQFARKYAWRRQERWNTHPFHRRCLEASNACAEQGVSCASGAEAEATPAAVGGGESATAALFQEVLGEEAWRQDCLQRGLFVREAVVQARIQDKAALPGPAVA